MIPIFKGFTQTELISTNPLLLTAILSEELARQAQALKAINEEMKLLRKKDTSTN